MEGTCLFPIPSYPPPLGTQRCVIDSVDDASPLPGCPLGTGGAKRSPPPIHRKVTRGRGDAAPFGGALRARLLWGGRVPCFAEKCLLWGAPPRRRKLSWGFIEGSEGACIDRSTSLPCPPKGHARASDGRRARKPVGAIAHKSSAYE